MVVNLHFTDFCNYRCKHCFVNKEGKELSLDEIKVIVDKIKDYSISSKKDIRINLAGGEPLLSKNINEIINYIYNKGLEVSIITNGYYLTKSFIIKNKDKLSCIGISVDSINEVTNMLIGRTMNDKVLNFDKIIDFSSVIKSASIKLKINICISKYNFNEDLSQIIKALNPDRLKILRVMTEHLKDNNLNITDMEWNRIILKYNKYNPIFEDNDYMKENYLIVDSTGNLSKNNLHINNNSLLGDISFEEALNKIE